MKDWIKGANPYMPLWEHVPDGEPRAFTFRGETRVYVGFAQQPKNITKSTCRA